MIDYTSLYGAGCDSAGRLHEKPWELTDAMNRVPTNLALIRRDKACLVRQPPHLFTHTPQEVCENDINR
jgi:hypothetical protein